MWRDNRWLRGIPRIRVPLIADTPTVNSNTNTVWAANAKAI